MLMKRKGLACFLSVLVGMGIYGYTGNTVSADQGGNDILEEGYTYQFKDSRVIGSRILIQGPIARNGSVFGEERFASQIQSNVVAMGAYRALETHIEELKTGKTAIPFHITIPSSYRTSNFGKDLQTGIDAFDRDYSEVFWIDISKMMFYYKSSRRGDVFSGEIRLAPGEKNYFASGYSSKADVTKDIARVDAQISELTAKETGSDYDKVKFFHDYLVKKNAYNTQLFSNRASSKAWEITSGLYYGSTSSSNVDNPVCEGYARSLKVLCDAVGIPNVLVSGYADGEDHMWNYVKLDGKWYAVDVTWDDPMYSYTPSKSQILKNQYVYFLKGSSDFPNHKNDGQVLPGGYTFTYPTLSVSNYNPTTKNIVQTGGSVQDSAVTPEGKYKLVELTPVVKTPAVSMNTAIGIGKYKTIHISNLQEDAEITYQSSNKKVVYVYSNGTIKGLKSGTAIITMNVCQGGKCFILQTVVTCK